MATSNLHAPDITDREHEVISLLAQDLTNNEIANRLYLSKNTIKWYVQQLNQKLYTTNREEIVTEAQRLGILGNASSETKFTTRKTNLPYQTTPFIGRDDEIEQLNHIINTPHIRLLTIVAHGGMGKTRIALELAEQQLNHYRDGVYFVPLQTVNDKSTIINHLADATDFQSISQIDDLKQQFLNYLSTKEMLLLLDNFEHLVNNAQIINEILEIAPQIKIIITSRERLNLLSETIYILKGMVYKNWTQAQDALQYDAVQLLQQSAQRVQPSWEITASNLPAVNRLCDVTDGMPLGLLLATSWMNVYSLDRICNEIQNSIDILTTNLIDVPQRQRSIRAIFDYSWALLSQKEQEVLAKFSVFRGGCSVEAVEKVTGATPIILQSLLSKALLNRTHDGRYDIHELLRQYATEKLGNTAQKTNSLTIHMSYYAQLVEENSYHLKKEQQLQAIKVLEDDFDNIQISWDWAIHSERYDMLERMLEGLRLFTLLTSRMNLYSDWLTKAISNLAVSAHEHIEVKLQIYYADALIECSLTEQSFEIVQAYKDKVFDGDDVVVKMLTTIIFSRASYILGDPETALDYGQKMLQLAQEIEDSWHQAQAHYALSLLTGLWNAYKPIEHVEMCVEIASAVGDRYWLSQGCILGGLMLARIGENAKAKDYLEQALDLSYDLNDKVSIMTIYSNLSAFHKADGQWQYSEHLQQKAMELGQHLGYSNIQIITILIKLSELRMIQGDISNAEIYLADAETLLDDVEYPGILSRYYSEKSAVEEYQGNVELGHEYALKAVGYIQKNMNWSMVQDTIQRFAWALCCTGDYQTAIQYVVQVAEQDLKSQNQWGLIKVSALLSLIESNNKNFERATQLIGLIDQHEIQSVWLQTHPKLLDLRQQLSNYLGDEVYQMTLENGGSLKMQVIIQEWLDKHNKR